jgi:cytochrome c556
MRNSTLLAFAAATVLSACAVNVENHAPPPPAFDAQALVDARQGGMAMSVAALGAVSSGFERKAPARSYRLPASGLAKFARSMPLLFDPRTASLAGTKIKPVLWTDPNGFAQRSAQYRDASAALVDAITADDPAAIEAALASTKAACKACHDAYRAE